MMFKCVQIILHPNSTRTRPVSSASAADAFSILAYLFLYGCVGYVQFRADIPSLNYLERSVYSLFGYVDSRHSPALSSEHNDDSP